MKKYLLTLLTLFVLLAPNVKAEDKIYSFNFPCSKESCLNAINNNSSTLNAYYDYLEKNKSTYDYYFITYSSYGKKDSFELFTFTKDKSVSFTEEVEGVTLRFFYNFMMWVDDSGIQSETNYDYSNNFYYDLNLFHPYFHFYDTNYKLQVTSFEKVSPGIDFYSTNETLIFNQGDLYPSIKELVKYNSFAEFKKNQSDPNVTTVNLDNYEYVILNLKDYNQTKAFNTNLKVKGSIGITPIYNFGQTEKSDIIGTKIEDRCNVKYDEFTDYRLSILKQDLKNNAVYIVKSCEEGSSFKFDNTIFNVTYVTADNVDDPVVTIGGKDYHTIPFNKLTSSANQNEEENYVPGESKKLNLSDIVSNITNTVSSFWDSIVNFMSLVTKFFNTLPIEIKGVAITTFSMACMIALIKFLKS